MKKQIWKCEGEGDTVYLEAENLTEAFNELRRKLGPVTRNTAKFTEVDSLPEGEKLL